MASVNRTIITMIRDFPDLFQSRTDCLHHLFAVVGNGYEWRDGQLVNRIEKRRDDDIFKGRISMLDAYFRENKGRKQEWIKEHAWEMVVSKNAKIFADRKEFLSDCYTIGPYSAILNLPNDIKPDWLEAANQFAGLFMHFVMSKECVQDDPRGILKKIENRIAVLRRKQK